MNRLIFCISLCLCFVTCKRTTDYENLTTGLEKIINHNKFNGVILLKHGDQVIFSKVKGYANLNDSIELKKEDCFIIGSVSKQITAALVLREVENGRLTLDDKIGKYLTNVTQPWKSEISIHHLLTHTHGIIDINKPTIFKVGNQFKYSQLGYHLLAQILEQVTNKPFNKLTADLFQELTLNHTFHPKDKLKSNLVLGYEEVNPDSLIVSPYSLENYAAAGSIISNANDMLRWNELLHSGNIVKPETLALMKTDFATRQHPIFGEIEYGYGLLFNKGESNIEIGALGYAPGFVTSSYYYPNTNLNLVILQNTALNLPNYKRTFKTAIECMQKVKKWGLYTEN